MKEIYISGQTLTVDGGILQGASDTVRYESVHFNISGTEWDGLDSYDAIFYAEQLNCKKVIHLDSSRACYIPWECLAGITDVYVCVGGFNTATVATETRTTYRITTFNEQIAKIDQSLFNGGTGEAEVTPTQFEQFVNEVKDKVKEVEDMTVSSTTLPAGSTATVTKTMGTVINLEFGLPQGADGDDGKGIVSIVKTGTAGLVDTYTITYTDATTSTFTVTNGAQGASGSDGDDGRGVASISKTATVGKVDTYTITYTDSTTSTFTVTNGNNGADGVGIVSIAKTGTVGLVDTYTITYTDGSTSTFTVTNGSSTWGSITGTLSAQTDLQTALDGKAGVTSVYTKAQTDTAIANHHDATKVDVVAGKGLSTNDFDNTYKAKLDSAIGSDAPADGKLYGRKDNAWEDVADYATVDWANVNNKPSTYTPSTHTHDDRYYTEAEADALLLQKADKLDTYTKAQTDTAISNHHDTTKVDKITGKGLSSNDFTDTARDKLVDCITDAPEDNKTWARRNGEWVETTTGKTIEGIYVGTVVDGGTFPTTRLDGTPLHNDDYVKPARGQTFPITVQGVVFNAPNDVAYYENGIWILEPSIIQDTSETPCDDSTVESVSGTSATQKAVNIENVGLLNSKVRKVLYKNYTRAQWVAECTDDVVLGIGTFTDVSPTGETTDCFSINVSQPTVTDYVITASDISGVYFCTYDGSSFSDWQRIGKQVHYLHPGDIPDDGVEDNIYIPYVDTDFATLGKIEKNISGSDKWMKLNPAIGAQYIEDLDYIMWTDAGGDSNAARVCFIEPDSINYICIECAEADAQFKYEAKHGHLIPATTEAYRVLYLKAQSTLKITSKDTDDNSFIAEGTTNYCKDFAYMQMVRAIMVSDLVECDAIEADFVYCADYYDSTATTITQEEACYMAVGETGSRFEGMYIWKDGEYQMLMSRDNLSHVEGWDGTQVAGANYLTSIGIDGEWYNIPQQNTFYADYASIGSATPYSEIAAADSVGKAIVCRYKDSGQIYYSDSYKKESGTNDYVFKFLLKDASSNVKEFTAICKSTGAWSNSSSSHFAIDGDKAAMYGESATADTGARLWLDNESSGGGFGLTARASVEEKILSGQPDGTLTWGVNDVITSAGGTMTGTIHAGTCDIIDRTVDDSYIMIYGGKSSTDGGAVLGLAGKDSTDGAGMFSLCASNGTDTPSLDGHPNGTLEWDGHSVITSIGGTMSGALTYNTTGAINRGVDNSYIQIKGGQASTSGGAQISLSGKSNSGTEGVFEILASNGTDSAALVGRPYGTLSWDGKTVLTSEYIINSLDSTDPTKALSAYQGKVLEDYKVGKLSSMPTPTSDMNGKIYQFVGTTTSTYTNGFFYKVVPDGSAYKWENVAVQPAGGDCLPLVGGTMTGTISTEAAVAMNGTADNSSVLIKGGSTAGQGAQLRLYGKSSSSGSFMLQANNGASNKSLVGRTNGNLTWDENDVVICVNCAGTTSLNVKITTTGLSMLNVEGRLVAVMYYDNMFTVNGESVAVGGTAQIGARTLTFAHSSGNSYFTVTADQDTYMSAILM